MATSVAAASLRPLSPLARWLDRHVGPGAAVRGGMRSRLLARVGLIVQPAAVERLAALPADALRGAVDAVADPARRWTVVEGRALPLVTALVARREADLAPLVLRRPALAAMPVPGSDEPLALWLLLRDPALLAGATADVLALPRFRGGGGGVGADATILDGWCAQERWGRASRENAAALLDRPALLHIPSGVAATGRAAGWLLADPRLTVRLLVEHPALADEPGVGGRSLLQLAQECYPASPGGGGGRWTEWRGWRRSSSGWRRPWWPPAVRRAASAPWPWSRRSSPGCRRAEPRREMRGSGFSASCSTAGRSCRGDCRPGRSPGCWPAPSASCASGWPAPWDSGGGRRQR